MIQLDSSPLHCSFIIILILLSENESIETIGNLHNEGYTYEVLWYHQQVNHFDFCNASLFKQRYLVYDKHWHPEDEDEQRKPGPIFFYTGNEGDIETLAHNTGFMWDIAKDFHAMLVFAEHRYYGQSIPLEDSSRQQGNPQFMGYLSSEQALADYAELLTYIKSNITGAARAPVIAFGGSYGGMLAAWLRVKYPHICDGAIASSAPISQFTTNCHAVSGSVTSIYKNGDEHSGAKAVEEIGNSWDSINHLGSTTEGMIWLREKFKLCSEIDLPVDISNLKKYLKNLWTNVAMMNYPYPASFAMSLPGNPVVTITNRIVDVFIPNIETFGINDNDDYKTVKAQINIDRILAGAQIYYNYTGNTVCLNLHDPDELAAEMWDYQSCTEMIMPMCSEGGEYDMFEKHGWNIRAIEIHCQEKWKVFPRPQMVNINYGYKNLRATSNIVFSNGLKDPWNLGGITKDISDSVIATLIVDGAHHLDLRGNHYLDSTSVRETRHIHKRRIKMWVNQALAETFQPDWHTHWELNCLLC